MTNLISGAFTSLQKLCTLHFLMKQASAQPPQKLLPGGCDVLAREVRHQHTSKYAGPP